MEESFIPSWLGISLLATILFLLLLIKRAKDAKNGGRRPPGPRGWPVIGNMLELGDMPHRSLFKLRFKYGPVIWLKLGSVNTVVVQSAKAAEIMFKNHDLAFADRRSPEALTSFGFNEGAMAFNIYTPYWREIRKICAAELLSNIRLNETADIRRQGIDKMVSWIEDESKASKARGESGEIDIADLSFRYYFSLIGQLTLSRDVLGSENNDGPEFFEAMVTLMELATAPNVSDFLPFLKWLDPEGIKRKMLKAMGRCVKIVARYVKERVEERKLGTKKSDLLEILLDYEVRDRKEGVPDKFAEHNIILIILEMFLAGSETTSSAIEWAMAALMRYPEQMKKVKEEELDRVVGPTKNVEESDIDKLPYLQAVLKETFRCYVTTPLLPRSAREDTNYMGYFIPKGTQLIVNGWGIGRDPESWEDPLSFKPKRFLGSDLDYKGQHYEYLPFGSGRRMCAGLSLVHRTVPVIVANMLQHFDWELNSSMSPETLNMEEKFGLSLRKLEPLKVIPKKRFVH